MEPVRPMNQPTVNQTVQHGSRFSFSSPQGKKESVPVISDYYPNRIVYPLAKVDRRIDNRLVQAATLAQERAHGRSLLIEPNIVYDSAMRATSRGFQMGPCI